MFNIDEACNPLNVFLSDSLHTGLWYTALGSQKSKVFELNAGMDHTKFSQVLNLQLELAVHRAEMQVQMRWRE